LKRAITIELGNIGNGQYRKRAISETGNMEGRCFALATPLTNVFVISSNDSGLMPIQTEVVF